MARARAWARGSGRARAMAWARADRAAYELPNILLNEYQRAPMSIEEWLFLLISKCVRF